MPDPTPQTPTEPKRKSPGPLDAKLLDRLEKDEEIIADAIDEMTNDGAFATDLATHFLDSEGNIAITVASLNQLAAEAAATRATGTGAVGHTADFHDITDEEQSDFNKAIAAVRSVQARAKEKYEETHPAQLEAYFVGQPLGSREQVRTAGAAVWAKIRTTDDGGNPVTPQDTLPGLTQAKIDQVKADLGDYAEVQTRQSGAQEGATASRGSFSDQCEQIRRRRRRLQLAVDAERPHGVDSQGRDNTALRRRLKLPTDKGMS